LVSDKPPLGAPTPGRWLYYGRNDTGWLSESGPYQAGKCFSATLEPFEWMQENLKTRRRLVIMMAK
jgi:hypothetical protein